MAKARIVGPTGAYAEMLMCSEAELTLVENSCVGSKCSLGQPMGRKKASGEMFWSEARVYSEWLGGYLTATNANSKVLGMNQIDKEWPSIELWRSGLDCSREHLACHAAMILAMTCL